MEQPDNQTEFPAAEAYRISQWMAEKNCSCPACMSPFAKPTDFGSINYHSGRVASPRYRPVLLMECATCGHISFFCPIKMGLKLPQAGDEGT